MTFMAGQSSRVATAMLVRADLLNREFVVMASASLMIRRDKNVLPSSIVIEIGDLQKQAGCGRRTDIRVVHPGNPAIVIAAYGGYRHPTSRP
jgi:hypothetical protein